MSPALWQRIWSLPQVRHEPVTIWLIGVLGGLLVVSLILINWLQRTKRVSEKLSRELTLRYRTWLVLVALFFVPWLLGAGWFVLAVAALSLLCYREYARCTGLFREQTISVAVVIGIALVTFATWDNYPRLFFASAALTVGVIMLITIPQDRPQGFIQRTALGVLGFLLFGYSLGYLGYFANHPAYRPVVLLLVLAVELNDVFAFCCGKLIGGRKILPQTSPGKTWAGSLGAVVLTTVFVATLGHWVFRDTPLDDVGGLVILGAGISMLGQFGDLVLSAIKRDIGLKDTGTTLPGHGGLLDRFDSLVLVPPAAFHWMSLYLGPIGEGQWERILTGGF